MSEKITTGTVLIKEGTRLPECFQLESAPYLRGWRLSKNLGSSRIDRKLCEAGWTLSFLAGDVNATAVESDLERATRRAVRKLVAGMKSDQLNCLEIAQVASKRLLGLPYVKVAAHPRHILERMSLFHAKPLAEWDRIKLAAA
jgi:hypothetical protein